MPIKPALLWLCIGICYGCAQPLARPPANPPTTQFATLDGTLWAHSSGGRFNVPVQGQAFRPLPSPNGEWLAVEVQTLSNLRTLRIFRQSEHGFAETAQNASTYLWQQARVADAVDTDNIRDPAVGVINWLADSRGLNVELHAVLDSGEPYRRRTVLKLRDLMQ